MFSTKFSKQTLIVKIEQFQLGGSENTHTCYLTKADIESKKAEQEGNDLGSAWRALTC